MLDYSQNEIVVEILNKYSMSKICPEVLKTIQNDLGGAEVCSVYPDTLNPNSIRVEFKSSIYLNKGPISPDNDKTHNWRYIGTDCYRCLNCNMEKVIINSYDDWADANLSCDEMLIKEIIE
jgi:hypothetical protein